jgi:hypothetical protein
MIVHAYNSVRCRYYNERDRIASRSHFPCRETCFSWRFVMESRKPRCVKNAEKRTDGDTPSVQLLRISERVGGNTCIRDIGDSRGAMKIRDV